MKQSRNSDKKRHHEETIHDRQYRSMVKRYKWKNHAIIAGALLGFSVLILFIIVSDIPLTAANVAVGLAVLNGACWLLLRLLCRPAYNLGIQIPMKNDGHWLWRGGELIYRELTHDDATCPIPPEYLARVDDRQIIIDNDSTSGNMNKHPFIPASAAVALCFGLLCLSALSSCTGCSYNHEKAMGSIDNILGKVDTLMKKTDRFLEEHLPEEPPIDYEKEGVNMKHLFVFTDTTMTYNGKSFMPGMSIGELCEIFGNYERLAEPGIFIWDSMGIIMVSHDESGKGSAPVSRIMINWNIELSGFITDEDLKWLKNRCPRQYFTGKMIVGGAVLGRGMHMDDFLKKTNLKFNNNPFPLLYYCHLHDWDYTKAPIHRREKYYTYRIRKSEDGNDIENFDIAINSRGFGDPPYEGPEYEKYINVENQ